jgi:hypothetical protein
MKAHRLGWALGAALLAACGSYSVPDEVIYGQAVFTQPKPGFDFGSTPNGTYFLDPIVNAIDDTGTQTPELMPDAVVSTISAAMEGYGWTPAGLGSADVGLSAIVLHGTEGTLSVGYWCNYTGYTGCLSGWTYSGVYEYGTVVLQMGAPAAGGELVWAAVLHGAGGGGWEANLQARVDEALRRAFSQSPYLHR